MAWEWSHTIEAYQDAELNFRELPLETLLVIAAEWQANIQEEDETGFDERKYQKAYRRLIKKAYKRTLDVEALQDEVWGKIEQLATCTNGGWQAHLCPFGCGCHMVPFHRREEQDQDISERQIREGT